MPQSPSKNLFPLLNLGMVQEFAEKILSHFPYLHVTKVTLYKNTPRLAAFLPRYKTTYILVIEVLDLDRYTQQYEKLRKYLKPPFDQKLFSLTGDALAGTYLNPPSPEYNYWDEWDFHLVTVNRKNVPIDYITASEDFATQAQQPESTIIFSNDKSISLNDEITVNRNLQVLCSRIEYFSNRIEQYDRIEDLYTLKKLKTKFQHLLQNFIQTNTDLEVGIEAQKHVNLDTQQVLCSSESNQALFREDVDGYRIGFYNNINFYPKHKGFKYLKHILTNMNRKVNTIDMINKYNPKHINEISSDTVSTEDFSTSDVLSSKLPILDNAAIKDYQNKFNEFNEEEKQAKDMNDQGWIEQVKMKKYNLIKQFQEYYYHRKYGHKDEAQDKAIKAAGQRIKKAIVQIKNKDEALGTHLAQNIRPFARSHYYQPSLEIHWVSD